MQDNLIIMEFKKRIQQLISQDAKIIIISKNGLKADITSEISIMLAENDVIQKEYFNTLTKNNKLLQDVEVLKFNLGLQQEAIDSQLKKMLED